MTELTGDGIHEVCATLERLGIAFRRYDHPAVSRCAEAAQHVRNVPGVLNKSLLVESRDGQRFLVIVPCATRLNLKQLAEDLDCRRLSFASTAELQRRLHVNPGSVSPFGLWHDRNHEIAVVIHPDVLRQPVCQFHPNDNRATLVLTTADFLKFLSAVNHSPRMLT